MPLITDPLFWALAVPAVLLSGISKGGFASGAGNVAVPFMALVIPAPQAAGIALPVLCAMDIAGLRAWWGKWSRQELWAILPGGLLGIALGTAVFGLMSDQAVKLMVGAIALVFLARSLWQARPGRVAPPPSWMARAKPSLPVPDSPCNSTATADGAARCANNSMRRNAALRPTMRSGTAWLLASASGFIFSTNNTG